MTIPVFLSLPFLMGLVSLLATSRKALQKLFVAGGLLLAASGYWMVLHLNCSVRHFAFKENLMLDSISAIFVLLIVTIGFFSNLYASGYLFKEGDGQLPLSKLRRYCFFFFLFIFTMLLTVTSNNLGLMWIAIEATTLASTFLVNVDDKKSSIEAAWKYLILCTVGIALALFGVILVYYSIASHMPDQAASLNWSFLMDKAKLLDPKIIRLAFIFVLVGYGTKVGLAPFHCWLPDAHSQAPSPVSALLSGVLLSCASLSLLRFHMLTQAVTGSDFSSGLLILFGVLSIAVAVPFIWDQADYKRVLAYSSVEHMGLVALGFGIGGPWGNFGALLHIVNHAFTKSLLFFCAGHLLYQYQTKEIKKVHGIFRKDAFLGSIFFFAMLAIAGLPLFSIFLSEFFILTAVFVAQKYFIGALVLVFLSLIFAGLLRHASAMTFGSGNGSPLRKRSFIMDTVLGVGMVMILVMGFYIPHYLQQLIGQASVLIPRG
jgi:hydrogenase-4 component F